MSQFSFIIPSITWLNKVLNSFKNVLSKLNSSHAPDDDSVCILVNLALTIGDTVVYDDIVDEFVSRGPKRSDPVMDAKSPSLVLPPQLVDAASLKSSSSIKKSSDKMVQLISMSRDAVFTFSLLGSSSTRRSLLEAESLLLLAEEEVVPADVMVRGEAKASKA